MTHIELVCGECENTETAPIGPTLSISGEMEITVTEVSCSKCGYEGPPGDGE